MAITIKASVRAQVGFKDLQFMQLHAEAVLDLVERAGSEIQFRAVAGDFRLLQGKFLLSQPEPEVRAPPLLMLELGPRKVICVHVKYRFLVGPFISAPSWHT
jgi:hypothetical protein